MSNTDLKKGETNAPGSFLINSFFFNFKYLAVLSKKVWILAFYIPKTETRVHKLK